jgi:hypothetical protein
MANSNNGKFMYLITYSQADVTKCSTRLQFASLVCDTFNNNNNNNNNNNSNDNKENVVSHWVCCVEKHVEEGVHFHMAIKLLKRRRFTKVAESLRLNHGIHVHFQEWASFYYDAYQYVTKEDVDALKSEGHPPLSNSPLTRKAVGKRKSIDGGASSTSRHETPKSTTSKRPRRLDQQVLYEIVVKNNVRSDLELCALAKIQYDEGKFDVHKYVVSTKENARLQMLSTCWKIHTAKEVTTRNAKSRLELLEDAAGSDHVVKNCQWLTAALQVLTLNGYKPNDFTEAVRKNIELGRGKGRNILIHGEGDRAKSFLLMPLLSIYSVFMCPAQNKFNWVGAWDKEVIFLNDLNYTEDTMDWGNFLNLLEGAPVSIGVPKNHFSEDVMWRALTPIFATAARPIVRVDGKKIDYTQTDMMNYRWTMFHFTHKFEGENKKHYEPCAKCFAMFILGRY